MCKLPDVRIELMDVVGPATAYVTSQRIVEVVVPSVHTVENVV